MPLVSWKVVKEEQQIQSSLGRSTIFERTLVNEGDPVLHYLKDGGKRGFVREELQIVPP